MNKLVSITFCISWLFCNVAFGSYNSGNNRLQKAYFDLLHQNNEVSKSDKDSLSSNSLSSEQSYFQNDANEDSEDMNLFEKQQPSYEDRNAMSQMAFDEMCIEGHKIGDLLRKAANDQSFLTGKNLGIIKDYLKKYNIGFQPIYDYLAELYENQGQWTDNNADMARRIAVICTKE